MVDAYERLSEELFEQDTAEGVPVSSAMKSARPMPMGAMYVALCFSAANMKMVKTNCAVRNISMKTPCTTFVPPPSDVRITRGPGNRTLTMPALDMAPAIWEMTMRSPRNQDIAPMRHIPRVTLNIVSCCISSSA